MTIATRNAAGSGQESGRTWTCRVARAILAMGVAIGVTICGGAVAQNSSEPRGNKVVEMNAERVLDLVYKNYLKTMLPEEVNFEKVFGDERDEKFQVDINSFGRFGRFFDAEPGLQVNFGIYNSYKNFNKKIAEADFRVSQQRTCINEAMVLDKFKEFEPNIKITTEMKHPPGQFGVSPIDVSMEEFSEWEKRASYISISKIVNEYRCNIDFSFQKSECLYEINIVKYKLN